MGGGGGEGEGRRGLGGRTGKVEVKERREGQNH